ncbi:LacI family DNA-binding transcriptional regulator [soil metagenome]
MDQVRSARRTTLADVAARAGVSRATASRALSGDARISESTRAAVRDAAQALEYVPNVAARGLRARHTRVLGLLLSDFSDPVHGQVAAGFELEAGAAGYTVIIMAARNVPAEERRALTVFVERSADGICMASSTLDPDQARSRSGACPLVVVQPDHPRILDGPEALPRGTIRTDDASGVEQAVRHLLAMGHRDIAYVGTGNRATDILRCRTAERIVREQLRVGLRVISVAEDAWTNPASLSEALGPEPPRAVICYDDKMALALIDGLRMRELEVPRDVAVVGYDGIPFAALSNPRLTTVATPTVEMGQLAARCLVEAIDSGSLTPPRTLPVQLVVRESSGPPRSQPGRLPHLVARGG